MDLTETLSWLPEVGSKMSSETQPKYVPLRITKIKQCSQLWLHDLLPVKLDTENEDRGDNEGEKWTSAIFMACTGKEETDYSRK